MNSSLNQRLLTLDTIPHLEARTLLKSAEGLKRAAQAGIAQQPLRGKHIAVLCSQADCQAADRFEAAAAGLGARISRIEPDAMLLRGDREGARATARVLGKLYDAVECDHLPADVALRLQREVGVPVYNGLASNEHPLARLLPAEGDENERRYLVQALLLATIG
jgi:ornithine carbamoyltransferase